MGVGLDAPQIGVPDRAMPAVRNASCLAAEPNNELEFLTEVSPR